MTPSTEASAAADAPNLPSTPFSALRGAGFALCVVALMTLGIGLILLLYGLGYNFLFLHHDLHQRPLVEDLIRHVQGGSNLLSIQAIDDALVAAFIFWRLPKLAQTTRRALGLVRPSWRDLQFAFGGAALAYAGTALISAVIENGFHIHSQQKVVQVILGLHGVDIALATVTAVVIAPIAEESIFRGFVYNAFKANRFGSLSWALPIFLILSGVLIYSANVSTATPRSMLAPAVIAVLLAGAAIIAARRSPAAWTIPLATLFSATLFAAAHGELFAVPELLVPGAIFAVLYERTQSIWSNIFCHALFNSGAFIAIFAFHATQ